MAPLVTFNPEAGWTPPFPSPPASFVKARLSCVCACACPVPNISQYLGGSLGRLSYGGGWKAFGLDGLKSPMCSRGPLVRCGVMVGIGMSEPATSDHTQAVIRCFVNAFTSYVKRYICTEQWGTYRSNTPGGAVTQFGHRAVNRQRPVTLLRRMHSLYHRCIC